MSAEHKRPLYAFGAVSALCMFLLMTAIVRGDALSVAFHAPVPIAAPAAEARVVAAPDVLERVPAPAQAQASVSLPRELTSHPLSRAASPRATIATGEAAGKMAITATSEAETAEVDPSTPPAPEVATSTQRKAEKAAAKAQRKAEKAAERAARKVEKAAAKAQRQAERAEAKAQRQAEQAAAKVQREAELAAAKILRETELAAAKAQREAEHAQAAAERAAQNAARLLQRQAQQAEHAPSPVGQALGNPHHG